MILFVGDLHAQMSNFEDTKAILDLVLQVTKEKRPSHIIFLGDVFHTHSVIRQEVGFFIKEEIAKLSEHVDVIILAGNHDGYAPHSVKFNSVRLLLGGMKNVRIVDNEETVEYLFSKRTYVLLPFMGDQQKMIDICQKLTSDLTLICHQTFDGAAYENKMLAPGGINQNLIPQRKIISGHIHMEQQVGKVYYPGTPRALTANEVNQDKFLFLFNEDDETFTKVPTNHLVKTFKSKYLVQGENDANTPIAVDWKDKDDVRINVHGNEEYYKAVIEANKHLEGKVRFIPNIRKHINKILDMDDSSSSIEQSFHKYVHIVYDASDSLRGRAWNKMIAMAKKTGNSKFS